MTVIIAGGCSHIEIGFPVRRTVVRPTGYGQGGR